MAFLVTYSTTRTLFPSASSLAACTEYIISQIKAGRTASVIARSILNRGYNTTESNICHFIKSTAARYGLKLSKYRCTTAKYDADGNRLPAVKYATRNDIFNHLWMNTDLPDIYRDYLWSQYKVLPELDRCVRLFREVLGKKNMPCLYFFVERYKASPIKELASFARGLEKDMDAVENAVASPLSNGFVEGTNSKLKTIKKAMYGRCGSLLLKTKLMYDKSR